jgi:hypothetical protein
VIVRVQKKNVKCTDVWVPTEVDIDAHIFEPSGFSKEDFAAPHFVENYIADLATAINELLTASMGVPCVEWDIRTCSCTYGSPYASFFRRWNFSHGLSYWHPPGVLST